MFMLNLKTVCKWLSMTEFEIFLNVLGLFFFTILLAVKVDFIPDTISWFHVFLPLFLADFLQANFMSILFIRQVLDNQTKNGVFRLVISIILLSARLIFKSSIYFVLAKSSSSSTLRLQFVGIPIFFHLSFIMLRSCGLKKY